MLKNKRRKLKKTIEQEQLVGKETQKQMTTNAKYLYENYNKFSTNYSFFWERMHTGTIFKMRELSLDGPLTCNICLDDFSANSDCFQLNECGHILHAKRNCMRAIQPRGGTCPICRCVLSEPPMPL